MQFNELLKACALGEMPEVTDGEGRKGRVTVIKNNGKHRGCGVVFPGLEYDTWFSDSDETDKRTRYMRDLTLVDQSGSAWDLIESALQANDDLVRRSEEEYYIDDSTPVSAMIQFFKEKTHPVPW